MPPAPQTSLTPPSSSPAKNRESGSVPHIGFYRSAAPSPSVSLTISPNTHSRNQCNALESTLDPEAQMMVSPHDGDGPDPTIFRELLTSPFSNNMEGTQFEYIQRGHISEPWLDITAETPACSLLKGSYTEPDVDPSMAPLARSFCSSCTESSIVSLSDYATTVPIITFSDISDTSSFAMVHISEASSISVKQPLPTTDSAGGNYFAEYTRCDVAAEFCENVDNQDTWSASSIHPTRLSTSFPANGEVPVSSEKQSCGKLYHELCDYYPSAIPASSSRDVMSSTSAFSFASTPLPPARVIKSSPLRTISLAALSFNNSSNNSARTINHAATFIGDTASDKENRDYTRPSRTSGTDFQNFKSRDTVRSKAKSNRGYKWPSALRHIKRPNRHFAKSQRSSRMTTTAPLSAASAFARWKSSKASSGRARSVVSCPNPAVSTAEACNSSPGSDSCCSHSQDSSSEYVDSGAFSNSTTVGLITGLPSCQRTLGLDDVYDEDDNSHDADVEDNLQHSTERIDTKNMIARTSTPDAADGIIISNSASASGCGPQKQKSHYRPSPVVVSFYWTRSHAVPQNMDIFVRRSRSIPVAKDFPENLMTRGKTSASIASSVSRSSSAPSSLVPTRALGPTGPIVESYLAPETEPRTIQALSLELLRDIDIAHLYPQLYQTHTAYDPAPYSSSSSLGEEDNVKPKTPRSEQDLYTPRWVQGRGGEKQGLCPICMPEKECWRKMKCSAYWYHLHYHHGISALTGLMLPAPERIEFQDVSMIPEQANLPVDKASRSKPKSASVSSSTSTSKSSLKNVNALDAKESALTSHSGATIAGRQISLALSSSSSATISALPSPSSHVLHLRPQLYTKAELIQMLSDLDSETASFVISAASALQMLPSALCADCHEWVPLTSTSGKRAELVWWKHAQRCQMTTWKSTGAALRPQGRY